MYNWLMGKRFEGREKNIWENILEAGGGEVFFFLSSWKDLVR